MDLTFVGESGDVLIVELACLRLAHLRQVLPHDLFEQAIGEQRLLGVGPQAFLGETASLQRSIEARRVGEMLAAALDLGVDVFLAHLDAARHRFLVQKLELDERLERVLEEAADLVAARRRRFVRDDALHQVAYGVLGDHDAVDARRRLGVALRTCGEGRTGHTDEESRKRKRRQAAEGVGFEHGQKIPTFSRGCQAVQPSVLPPVASVLHRVQVPVSTRRIVRGCAGAWIEEPEFFRR